MSFVTWPCRKSLASEPVNASLPRSDLSTTKVTDETLAILEAREPPLHLGLELVHHALARHAGLQRRAHDGRLLGAAEPLEQREQPVEVEGEGVTGHVYALSLRSCRSPTTSSGSSTRSRRTGPTSSSTCASTRTATSTPPRCS